MTSDPMAPRCTAKSKQTGEQCKQRPIPGGTVCRFHGGKAPAVAAAAAARVVEQEAGKVLSKVWNRDAEPVTNAVVAMQKLAGRLEHAADVLGQRLGSGEDPCEHCGRGDLAMDSAEAVAWLRVLREDRQLLEAMERLGIAQTFAQIEAEKVRSIAGALGRVFEVVGLDAEQRQLGMRVLLEELRAGVDVVPGEVTS